MQKILKLPVNINHRKYKPYYNWIGLLLIQFFLFSGIKQSSYLYQKYLHFFEVQKEIHIIPASEFTFSVGDFLYIFVSVYILTLLLKRRSLGTKIRSLLIFINMMYFIFQVNWGLLYAEEPLMNKLEQKDPPLKFKIELAKTLISNCNSLRNSLPENKREVFTIHNKKRIGMDILYAQNLIPKDINQKAPIRCPSFKPSLFSFVLSKTGIQGYYNPFTAEAQFNANLPDSYLPFTMSHESAHQMGYAREEEANFIGYLIATNSDDPQLKYSGQLFATKYLLYHISELDLELGKSLADQFSQKVKADLENERRFREENQGLVNTVFSWSNDLFLKSNGQDGIVSYSYFLDLFLSYQYKKRIASK